MPSERVGPEAQTENARLFRRGARKTCTAHSSRRSPPKALRNRIPLASRRACPQIFCFSASLFLLPGSGKDCTVVWCCAAVCNATESCYRLCSRLVSSRLVGHHRSTRASGRQRSISRQSSKHSITVDCLKSCQNAFSAQTELCPLNCLAFFSPFNFSDSCLGACFSR